MAKIEAILFDFGNVIINIDLDLTFKAFANLTGKTVENVKMRFENARIFERYERGDFNDDDFREIVRQTLGFPLNDSEIDEAWNALLLDVPYKRIELIQDLRAKYRVYLLSNTSNIHIQTCNQNFKALFNIPTVRSLFHKAFYSYEMELWKPQPEIYEAVLAETGHLAGQVLFIDDNPNNIKGAKELGFNTILHNPSDDICDVLNKYL